MRVDVEIREDGLARREQRLAKAEERLAQKEAELAAYVSAVQERLS